MSEKLAKKEWDELYHLLRRASVGCDTGERIVLKKLANHLLTEDGDYEGLLSFMDYYGSRFIAPEVWGMLVTTCVEIQPSRIVEVGAGYGWLGRSLADKYGVNLLTVDKRDWHGVDIVLDVETTPDLHTLVGILEPYDLIVCSEFLHCLDNPYEFMVALRHHYILILEYSDLCNSVYWSSYYEQLTQRGAKPSVYLHTMCTSMSVRRWRVSPYSMYVIKPWKDLIGPERKD